MRLIRYLFVFLLISCNDQQKSIEYFKKKEKLTHTDINYIVGVEYKLAKDGLHLLDGTDTSALRKSSTINSQIEEWEEVRKKNEEIELTKEELDQLETIISFRQIFIRRLNEALNAK